MFENNHQQAQHPSDWKACRWMMSKQVTAAANIPKILALKPDLVLTFSDLQADIAAKLIAEGLAVHSFNHRTIKGIFAMIKTLGAMVGAFEKSEDLVTRLPARLDIINKKADDKPRIRVYFEE